MAGQDNTSVSIQTKGTTQTFTLNKGESKNVRANVGAKVTSDKNVQVDVLAGDYKSTYEMRWFSLLPLEQWSNEYLSPVGDCASATRALIYNPNSFSLTVQYKEGPIEGFQSIYVPAGKVKETNILGDNKGTYFKASANFMVFQIIDTVNTGDIFDWGFPVQPLKDLSPQVLVGWGYGCEGNDCDADMTNVANHNMVAEHTESRSVVWVSPTSACTFHVDFDNDGTIDATYSAQQYESITIVDPYDKDMTGTMIWAVDSADLATGNPVNFAAAWGQDPDMSFSNDYKALDLGTTVPPYYCEATQKFACLKTDNNGNGKIDAGETCQVITRTINNCKDTVLDATTVEPCEDPSHYSEASICLDEIITTPTTTTTTTEATTTTQATTTTEATTTTQETATTEATTTEATTTEAATTTQATTTTEATTTTQATTSTTTTTQTEATTMSTTTGPKAGGGGGDPHFQRWGKEHSTCKLGQGFRSFMPKYISSH